MTMLIEFETKRLRLRQWTPTDREPFAALNADPRVMAYFPAPLTRSESDAMVDPQLPEGSTLQQHILYRLSRDNYAVSHLVQCA